MYKLIICDIDGTLANNHQRADLIPHKLKQGSEEAWREFNEACFFDDRIQPTVGFVHMMQGLGAQVFFITSRGESANTPTRLWLKAIFGEWPNNILRMRSSGDNRTPTASKLEMIEGILKASSYDTDEMLLIDDSQELLTAVKAKYNNINMLLVGGDHDISKAK